MAKSISDEELQLRKRARRRLVGAIALVTIVAVFLPMVLDHEPRPVSQDVSIQIPSPSSGAFTSKIVPVAPGVKSAPAPAPAPSSDIAAKPEVPAKSEPAAPAPRPATSEAPKVAAAPAAKRAEDAAQPAAIDTEAAPPKKPAAEKAQSAATPPDKSKTAEKAKPRAKPATAYVVQVAALNDIDKAKQIREQLAAAGIKVYTEAVPTPKGNVTRVRAGPYGSREDAEKARDKLKGMGMAGNVLPK